MIDAQVLDSIDKWLLDHPTVYCYSDTMLAASFPHGEALVDFLNGSQRGFDVATRLLVVRNMEIQTDRWEERWFGSECKSGIKSQTGANGAKLTDGSLLSLNSSEANASYVQGDRRVLSSSSPNGYSRVATSLIRPRGASGSAGSSSEPSYQGTRLCRECARPCRGPAVRSRLYYIQGI